MHKVERNETTTKSFKRLEKTENVFAVSFLSANFLRNTNTKKEDAT